MMEITDRQFLMKVMLVEHSALATQLFMGKELYQIEIAAFVLLSGRWWYCFATDTIVFVTVISALSFAVAS